MALLPKHKFLFAKTPPRGGKKPMLHLCYTASKNSTVPPKLGKSLGASLSKNQLNTQKHHHGVWKLPCEQQKQMQILPQSKARQCLHNAQAMSPLSIELPNHDFCQKSAHVCKKKDAPLGCIFFLKNFTYFSSPVYSLYSALVACPPTKVTYNAWSFSPASCFASRSS